jgi:hypothetical protein
MREQYLTDQCVCNEASQAKNKMFLFTSNSTYIALSLDSSTSEKWMARFGTFLDSMDVDSFGVCHTGYLGQRLVRSQQLWQRKHAHSIIGQILLRACLTNRMLVWRCRMFADSDGLVKLNKINMLSWFEPVSKFVNGSFRLFLFDVLARCAYPRVTSCETR